MTKMVTLVVDPNADRLRVRRLKKKESLPPGVIYAVVDAEFYGDQAADATQVLNRFRKSLRMWERLLSRHHADSRRCSPEFKGFCLEFIQRHLNAKPQLVPYLFSEEWRLNDAAKEEAVATGNDRAV